MALPEKQHVIVIGAGPAGLTAGDELIKAGYRVTILEKDPAYVGGIARTVHYKDFRFDIGGHRFFSKNASVTAWWRKRLPDDLLQVKRLSRIYYGGKYYHYPLKPLNALCNLGLWTSLRCLASYVWIRLFPIRPETSFQDWVSNRFGRVLFSIFFKSYTEKVWGIPCDRLSADWAAQRIRNLSIVSALWNAIKPKAFSRGQVIKTLIDAFEYPRFGPGMMWEKTRDDIIAAGGQIVMDENAIALNHKNGRIVSVTSRRTDGRTTTWEADHVITTCPLQETVLNLSPPLTAATRTAAQSLCYRAFITVVMMVRQTNLFPDQWIYIHSPHVKVGRIQNFNNWSPFMVPVPGITCLGMEYFCDEGDAFWRLADADLIALGKRELNALGMANADDIIDATVVHMPKTYPVYTPDYAGQVQALRQALAPFANLHVAGRNGMHKYDNQDHAMMTALFAARNIQGDHLDVWRINADAEYLEDKS